jgi:hypothetical protein
VPTGRRWSVAWVHAVNLGAARDRGHERRATASASYFVKGRLQAGWTKAFVVLSFTAAGSQMKAIRIWGVERRIKTYRCKPQFNNFPHGKSQSCHPLPSTSSSTIAPIFFLPLPLVTLTCASGQHTRLHVCRPQLLKFLQGLLHKNSVLPPTSSCARSKHGTSRLVPPHRHGIVIGTRQGGHGPRWHVAVHG